MLHRKHNCYLFMHKNAQILQSQRTEPAILYQEELETSVQMLNGRDFK